MSLRTAVLLLVSMTAAAAAAAPTPPLVTMRPGLWEITQSTDTPATGSKRTVTSQTCLSADDTQVVARILPRQHEAPLKCENRDVRVGRDGAIEWRIACNGKGPAVSGTGRMVPAAETFVATATLASKTAARTLKSEQTVSGKWISDCQ